MLVLGRLIHLQIRLCDLHLPLLRGMCLRCAHVLHCLFEKDYNHPTPYAAQSSWSGASDARASDSGEAFVGGWISDLPQPQKNQVWWFHYKVTEDIHPWAFKDHKLKRRIAALEMLGALFLTMYLCEKSSSLRGQVLLPSMGSWMSIPRRCLPLGCWWTAYSH